MHSMHMYVYMYNMYSVSKMYYLIRQHVYFMSGWTIVQKLKLIACYGTTNCSNVQINLLSIPLEIDTSNWQVKTITIFT